MKFLPAIILFLLAQAHALPVTLTWDAYAGAHKYRIWRGIDLLATVWTNEAEVEVPSGESSTLTVSAVMYDWETPQSEPLYVVLIEPKITIEFSSDLKNWHEQFTPIDHFARARKDYP